MLKRQWREEPDLLTELEYVGGRVALIRHEPPPSPFHTNQRPVNGFLVGWSPQNIVTIEISHSPLLYWGEGRDLREKTIRVMRFNQTEKRGLYIHRGNIPLRAVGLFHSGPRRCLDWWECFVQWGYRNVWRFLIRRNPAGRSPAPSSDCF